MSTGRNAYARNRVQVARLVVTGSLLLATVLLGGCLPFYVPTLPTGTELISSETMESIAPGKTTRADVLLKLGDPAASEDADQFFAYEWRVSYGEVGWATMGGFGSASQLWWRRCLAIEFEPNGTVSRSRYLRLGIDEGTSCLAEWHKQGNRGDEP